jgi:hypothetical protein
LLHREFVFRGHREAKWTLQTSIEREFTLRSAGMVETGLLNHFLRLAPRFLESHLVPVDDAGWLGLIQHYGGPTRLLDVTRSPYVALYFAFEDPGSQPRAVWAIDPGSCRRGCAEIFCRHGLNAPDALSRTAFQQAQLVAAVRRPHIAPMIPEFGVFQEFSGVFPLDPWKPDPRQSAQQGMFLCVADIEKPFEENLSALGLEDEDVWKLVLPGDLREEVLDRLATMNVTAATLFPDITGLARSLRTLPVRRARLSDYPNDPDSVWLVGEIDGEDRSK